MKCQFLEPLSILVLMLSVSINAFGQGQPPQSYKVISFDTHDKVLNLLFPLDALDEAKEFALILRYKPSFEPESQIVIVARDGKMQVTDYTSLDGNIYSKLNQIKAETNREDPLEMSKALQVRKRELTVPFVQIQRWRQNLIDGVAASLRPKKFETATPPKTTSVILDGTVYELWDSSGVFRGSGDFHYSVYGTEVSKRVFRDESPFIGWMKRIRKEISRLESDK
ncbi:MAG: hypothetical protein ND895_28300 [Pyrinomonadaceae bacterium]|nr:hypothetical protein [Pyrinomonadaceae bacterium]